MALPPQQPIIERRRDQVFPDLEPLEIERVRRFGDVRSFAKGDALFSAGQVGPGLIVILAGGVDVTRRGQSGQQELIVTHGPGQFLGELAQMAGRPSLANATAREPVQALMIAPDRLRALLIAEAELGERIMRALILRRMGLLEIGAGGPIIVGRAENGDVLRLQGFLRRNGHPQQLLNPDTDAEAKALIERFHVDPGQLPIVLCPGGQLLRNPERRRTGALRRPRRADRSEPDLRRRRRRRRAGRPRDRGLCRVGGSFRPCARLPGFRRPGRRLGPDRKLSRLSDRNHRHRADGAGLQSGPEIRRRNGDSGSGRRVEHSRRRRQSVRITLGRWRARQRPFGRYRQRRPISPPGRQKPRCVRRFERSLLGYAARSRSCAPTRRSPWSEPAIPPARPRCFLPGKA